MFLNSFFSSISPLFQTLTNHFCLTSLFIIIPINYIISNNSSYKDSYHTYSQHSKSISYTHANISNSVLATDCLNLLLVPLVNLLCSPPPSNKYINASPTCECSWGFHAWCVQMCKHLFCCSAHHCSKEYRRVTGR